jgi:hypothetical protein
LAEVAENRPNELLKIGDAHVNHIAMCAGVESNELLLDYFPVQVNAKAK